MELNALLLSARAQRSESNSSTPGGQLPCFQYLITAYTGDHSFLSIEFFWGPTWYRCSRTAFATRRRPYPKHDGTTVRTVFSVFGAQRWEFRPRNGERVWLPCWIER